MKNTSTNLIFGKASGILLLCAPFFLLTSGLWASPIMVQSIPQNITYTKLKDSLAFHGENAVREYFFDFNYLPEDASVLDVDVRIDLTHTWTQEVHMFLVSPTGMEVPFFEVEGCYSLFPINTIFDDEGMASGSCVDLETQARVQPLNLPGIPGSYLSAFDDQSASGIWTLRIEDHVLGGDGGVIFEVGLQILVDIPVIAGSILTPMEPAENLIANKIESPVLEKRNVDPGPEFMLFQNEPNPFQGNTVIRYDLPVSQDVTLTIFDITGRKVLFKHQESEKGQNFLVIQSSDIAALGVLYYRLEANGFSATKKMILID